MTLVFSREPYKAVVRNACQTTLYQQSSVLSLLGNPRGNITLQRNHFGVLIFSSRETKFGRVVIHDGLLLIFFCFRASLAVKFGEKSPNNVKCTSRSRNKKHHPLDCWCL